MFTPVFEGAGRTDATQGPYWCCVNMRLRVGVWCLAKFVEGASSDVYASF
jgi:hypothetical protein